MRFPDDSYGIGPLQCGRWKSLSSRVVCLISTTQEGQFSVYPGRLLNKKNTYGGQCKCYWRERGVNQS